MFKWAVPLALIIVFSAFSRHPASMTTTLPQLNQELEENYIKNKRKISDADFKALRVRLNLEVSSAQTLNDRENEIFKLLSYSTYAVYLTKKKGQIKTLKAFWDKFLQLPVNSESKALSDNFFGDLRKPQNYYDYIQFLEFYTDFFPLEHPPRLVFDFIRAQCEFYSEFRVEKKFYPCLKRLEPFTETRPIIRNLISGYEMNYLSRSKTDHAEYLKLVSNNLQTFPKNSSIHITTLARAAIYELLDGNTSQGASYLQELKAAIPGSPVINTIEATLFFAEGDYDKARKSFALLNLPETESDEVARYYYTLGALIDTARNDFGPALEKLKKHMDMNQNMPLHGLRTHLALLTLQALSQTPIDVKANQELIQKYESLIKQLKIQDSHLKVSLNIMKTLLREMPEDQKIIQLKAHHKELALHNLKFSLPSYALGKIIEKDSNPPAVPAVAKPTETLEPEEVTADEGKAGQDNNASRVPAKSPNPASAASPTSP